MFPQQFPIEPVRWLQVCFLVFKDTVAVMVFNLPLSLLLTSNFAPLWVENAVYFTSTLKFVWAFIYDPSTGSVFLNVYTCLTTMSCISLPGLPSQTEWLKRQNLIFSQFRRQMVQGQGVSRFGFFWSLSPWLFFFLLDLLLCSHWPVLTRDIPSVSLCVQNSSLYKVISYIWLGPTPKASF